MWFRGPGDVYRKRWFLPQSLYRTVSVEALTAGSAYLTITKTAVNSSVSSTNHGTGSFATSSFTPPDNTILVVGVGAIGADDNDCLPSVTISDSLGLTWTEISGAEVQYQNSGQGTDWVKFYYTTITTGASMTITVDCGANSIWQYYVNVWAFTNYNSSSPFGAIATHQSGTGGAPLNLTLNATPNASSYLVGMAVADSSGTATDAGTGWDEDFQSWGSGIGHVGQSKTGHTSTTVSFNAVVASSDGTAAVVLEIKAQPTSSSGISLTADAGSYALTGTAANLKFGRKTAADSGSYTLTGTAAGLVHGWNLAAAAGSYTLTGSSANLLWKRIAGAGAGSYALTGTAATLRRGYPLTASAGSYAWTGVAATLTHAWKVAAAAGSFTWNGQDAGLLWKRRLDAQAGSYSWTGTDATLTVSGAGGISLAADGGSYSLTGTAAGLLHGYRIQASGGSYALTGTAAGLLWKRRNVASSGSYVWTGTDAGLSVGLFGAPGVYTWTGTDAALVWSGASRQPQPGGGHGSDHAPMAPFIRWGLPKRKKKIPRERQIEIVADAIEQAAPAIPEASTEAERRALARVLLANRSLAELVKVNRMAAFIALIERELRNMEDEEVLLLTL